MKSALALLALALGLAVMLYHNGLNGPFLFDDHVHITQNQWVKINSLGAADLAQAWGSSFSKFPSDRPLAQLSFGINHALTGLDPRAFKATNLVIHLIVGLLIFVFSRLAYRAVSDEAQIGLRGNLFAVATAALWLLHPLHVSTVLYTVQRMAQLSTLSLLLGSTSYLYGRLRILHGRPGGIWIFAAAPIALIGFFAKENTVLLPLLLLSIELTLLSRFAGSGPQRFVRSMQIAYIAVPLLGGIAYLVLHPELYSHAGRPFTLEERLLTQTRVLASYLQWTVIPDLSEFALFHDDLLKSTGLLNPPSTLVATILLFGIALTALAARRSLPVFSFAILFFFANHALESSIFPLELMFEHRNYLASVGPFMLLAYLVVIKSAGLRAQSVAVALGILLLASYSIVTWMRVDNWSSYQSFVLSAVEHHPNSRRSNFMAAQMLIVAIDKSEGDVTDLAGAADQFLERGLEIDRNCIDCLFGKVALNLHLGRQPPRNILHRLQQALAIGDVSPTSVSISQFSFLVRWQRRTEVTPLAHADLIAIFDAALSNPGWSHTALAGISASYREYHEFVTGDLAGAEVHARAAVEAWPQQWGYHAHLVRVLRKRQQYAAARQALDAAETSVRNADQRNDFERLRTTIEHDLEQDANAD